MMKKYIRLTFFMIIIPLVIDMMIACKPHHATEGGLYRNTGFTVNNLDNSGSSAFITSSDSVLRQAYGIRLHLVRDKVADIRNPLSQFVQSAYAEYPIYYNGYFPLDSIVSIQIFTLSDFDTIHPANTEITDLFRVYQNYAYTIPKDYFSKISRQYSHLSDLQVNIDLLLMIAPSISKRQQFKIQMKLSNGKILEQETTMINLI